MPVIRIPTPFRPYTNGNSEIAVAGNTVGDALSDLARQYPDLRQHLYNEKGELRSFVNVFLADENVRFLRGVHTPLQETDQLRIVPSVAGGLDRHERK